MRRNENSDGMVVGKVFFIDVEKQHQDGSWHAIWIELRYMSIVRNSVNLSLIMST